MQVVLTGSALAVAIPVSLYATFMPPVSELWMSKPGTVTSDMSRSAEVFIAGISVGIGLIISLMIDSLAPFLLTTLVTSAIALAYESVLRKDLLSDHI